MDNLPIEERIARVCHEANREYCKTIGDNSQAEWKDAPQWQRDSAVQGVMFHLENHRHRVEPNPAASHENWLKQKTEEGWKYGPVKDPAKKEHPCCVPYHQLPVDQRMKDYIFGGIVAAFWNGFKGEVGFMPRTVGAE